MRKMKNHLKSLAVAAMLAWSVPTWAVPQVDVQNEISQVLTDSENQDKDTLSFWEEKVRLQIEESLNVAMKRKSLKSLVEFYWEDWVKTRMKEMVDEVYKNPDKYWTFDSKWNFTLNDDGDVWFYLFASKFGDYEAKVIINKGNVVAWSEAVLAVILAVICMYRDAVNTELKEDNTELKKENRVLKEENQKLKNKLRRLGNDA